MGQGDRGNVTPLSSPPQWIKDRLPRRGIAPDVDGEDHLDDRMEDNQTFLETETLCSRAGSLFQNPHQRHQQQNCTRTPPSIATATTATAAKVHTGDSIAGQSSDLGDESFLISPLTSFATIATTSTTRSAAVEATNNAHPPPWSSPHSRWRQKLNIELRLPPELKHYDKHRTNLRLPPGFLDDLDHELLLPDNHLIALDCRLSSSRSHLQHRWLNRSPSPDHSKYLRVSSDGPSPSLVSRPLTIITREEFESLPPRSREK
ncbi:hypothetical protein B0T10DRAFT_567760 [Thelonectria olida]|uniref:Uncharacterized protein n=1 Tax=Thelonectria olida TaxID=1576542 RepID=A0A9P9AFJ4_9HYPO|nr:hypothetical protein B0T10DRAFT_567760 [Thelonectria olida]